jgi:hypothetical protein
MPFVALILSIGITLGVGILLAKLIDIEKK